MTCSCSPASLIGERGEVHRQWNDERSQAMEGDSPLESCSVAHFAPISSPESRAHADVQKVSILSFGAQMQTLAKMKSRNEPERESARRQNVCISRFCAAAAERTELDIHLESDMRVLYRGRKMREICKSYHVLMQRRCPMGFLDVLWAITREKKREFTYHRNEPMHWSGRLPQRWKGNPLVLNVTMIAQN